MQRQSTKTGFHAYSIGYETDYGSIVPPQLSLETLSYRLSSLNSLIVLALFLRLWVHTHRQEMCGLDAPDYLIRTPLLLL